MKTTYVLLLLATVICAVHTQTETDEEKKERVCYNDAEAMSLTGNVDQTSDMVKADDLDESRCLSGVIGRLFQAEKAPAFPFAVKEPTHCRICPDRRLRVKYTVINNKVCKVVNPVWTVRCTGQRCCPGPQLIPTWQPWFFQTRCLPSYRVWQKAYAVCPNNKCYIKWLYLPTKCCCRRYRWWWWARSEKALCDDTHTQVTAK